MLVLEVSASQLGFLGDLIPLQRMRRVRSILRLNGKAQAICWCLLAAISTLPSVASADVVALSAPGQSVTTGTAPVVTPVQAQAALDSKKTDSALALASNDARNMADWIVHTTDNGKLPFAIVDKKSAKVFVFFADGRLRGTAPVLLGLAAGDETIPGIGNRPLSRIRPEERTTPAGRFVANMDHNLKGKEILWVDHDGAISMHPVVTSKPKERRLQRLKSPTSRDNRISFGCINVPSKFFSTVVRPAFIGTEGIVYVLPDTKTLKDVFTAYQEVNKKQSMHQN